MIEAFRSPSFPDDGGSRDIGEIFQLHRGFQLEYARPPTKQKFASLRAELQAAAEVAGKPNKLFTIAPFTTVNVLDGKNDDAKWQQARQILSFYINQMGVFYWQMLERNGYEAEVPSSRKAFAEGDRKGAFSDLRTHDPRPLVHRSDR